MLKHRDWSIDKNREELQKQARGKEQKIARLFDIDDKCMVEFLKSYGIGDYSHSRFIGFLAEYYPEKLDAALRSQRCCDAVLYHGPGHQSRTTCHRKGEHQIHECRYGRYEQLARWEGSEAYTGVFDEPPREPQER
jgi:hypothetical protein